MMDRIADVRHSEQGFTHEADHFSIALRSLCFIVLPLSLILLAGVIYGLMAIYGGLFG